MFTPDEVRKLDNKKCIIFIRGFDPIMDNISSYHSIIRCLIRQQMARESLMFIR
nr:hypothetical protein [Roseburia hominis]